MARVAILIYAGTETDADEGRLFNGLEAAAALAERVNDEVKVIFDGAGTEWIPRLADPSHEYHSLYASVEDVAACEGCVLDHGVEDAAESAGVEILRSRHDHTSMLPLVHEEYEVITF